MAHSSTHVQNMLDKQELDNFVYWSSKCLMEDEIDVARYFERFQTLSDPLLFYQCMSKRECDMLFWKGFHVNNRTALLPYLLDKCPNQQPGATLSFRELFDLAYPFLACKRLTTEAEAKAKAETEAVWQVVPLMRNVQNENLSIHDEAYSALYRQCIHIIPELAEVLPKPELSHEPVQNAPVQSTSHNCQAPSAPSSPARTPSSPIPELLTSPTDLVTSALDAPVDPSPAPPPASDFIDHTPSTTPPSLPTWS